MEVIILLGTESHGDPEENLIGQRLLQLPTRSETLGATRRQVSARENRIRNLTTVGRWCRAAMRDPPIPHPPEDPTPGWPHNSKKRNKTCSFITGHILPPKHRSERVLSRCAGLYKVSSSHPVFGCGCIRKPNVEKIWFVPIC